MFEKVFQNARFAKHVLRNLMLKRCFGDKNKKPAQASFNTPRPPKDPPDDYNPTSLGHKAFPPDNLPLAAFRPFQAPDEPLGPCADKCGAYRNPEYYAYHRFSFHTLQAAGIELARCSTGEQVLYDSESGFEDEQQQENSDLSGSGDGNCNGNGNGNGNANGNDNVNGSENDCVKENKENDGSSASSEAKGNDNDSGCSK